MQSLKNIICIVWAYVVGFLGDVAAHLKATIKFVSSSIQSSWNTICTSVTSICSSVHHFATLVYKHSLKVGSYLFHQAQHLIDVSHKFIVESKAYQFVATTINRLFDHIWNVCSVVCQKTAALANHIAAICAKSYHNISNLAIYVYQHVVHLCSVSYNKAAHLVHHGLTLIQTCSSFIYHKITGVLNSVFGFVANICSTVYHNLTAAMTHVYNFVARSCSCLYHKLAEIARFFQAHISHGLRAVHSTVVYPTYMYLSHGLTTIKSGVGMAICSVCSSVAENPVKTAMIFIALLTLSVVLYRLYKARKRDHVVRSNPNRSALNSAIKKNVPLRQARPTKVVSPDPFLIS